MMGITAGTAQYSPFSRIIAEALSNLGGAMAQRTDPARTVVEWPHSSVSSSANDNDLGPPLEQLLQDLSILGTPDAVTKAQTSSTAVRGGLPVSVSIIEAGATAASKGWAAAVAAVGGATAVWAAVTDFWNGQAVQTRGTLIIGAAIVVAACALAAAFIMTGDVRARGQGAAAQYYARSLIASEFLRGAAAVTRIGALPAVALTASGANPNSAGHDGLPDVLAGVKNAQEQVSGVNDVAQQILKETTSHSDDLQIAIVALALAQAGLTPVPVMLKNGGSGQAKRLIRSPDGEWKFLLDDQTWMPISEIAGFGNE
jgi:hypothetical protein